MPLGSGTSGPRQNVRLCAIALAATLLSAGCATTGAPAEREDVAGAEDAVTRQVDRFERMNRAVYRFNRATDRAILRPIARGYDRAVPQVVERRVRNFFTNLRAPSDVANSFLQGKFLPGLSGIGRFLLNSTAGIGGLYDPATKLGLDRHAEDFGQTLAKWRVPAGSYVVVPLLGPGTLRDWGGWLVDTGTDPLIRHDDTSERNSLFLWRYVSDRAVLLPAERALEESLDEYVFVREAYFQHRAYEIRDALADDDYSYIEAEEEE
jgi:phospholipid-binding lipoprotein MlaA